MAKDVFISYSTRDKAIAEKLCMILEELGLDCWIAPRDIAPGAEFDVAILDGIDQCPAMVVVLTVEANISVFVKNEVNRAFSSGKPILAFRVEDIKPARALEFYLARHQWTDGFPPPVEERIARMARALLELIGQPSEEPPICAGAGLSRPPFRETDAPAAQQAALEKLVHGADSSHEDVFLSVYKTSPHEAVRQAALKGLHKTCGEATIEHFTTVLNVETEERRRKEAIDFVCHDNRPRVNAAIATIVLEQLSIPLRVHLAKALMHISFPQGRMAAKVEAILRVLIQDDQPQVRGAALSTWCEWSGSEGYLNRKAFWQFVSKQDAATIEELFDSAINDTDKIFMPFESQQLVDLAERVPSIRSEVVYTLSEIGREDVAQFMSQFVQPEANDRRWAFRYFARCPSSLVKEECEREMRAGDDNSYGILAAAALARLGDREAIAFLIANYNACSDWLVKSPVYDSLKSVYLATKSKKLKQTISELLKN